MSASQFDEFDRRMRRINRRHSKLSHGYVTAVNSDGLVVAKPRRRSNRGMVRGLILIFVTGLLFKGILHAQIGPQAYNDRIDALAAGSVIERFGAVLMAPEPVTRWISSQVVSLVR